VIAGVDLPTLAALLGHTNITMTTRYVHPAESQKREAVAKLERLRMGWLAQESGKESPQKYPQ